MPFIVEPPDDKPQALEMEHIIFPLGLWLAGLVISLLVLLAEIIINYIENVHNYIFLLCPYLDILILIPTFFQRLFLMLSVIIIVLL